MGDMYRVHPSSGDETVTINCTANALECFPRCPGVDCPDFAAPPPPPLPRVSITVGTHLPVHFLLIVSFLSAFLFLSLVLFAFLLYRRRRLFLRRRRRAATAPLPQDDGFPDGDEEVGGGTGEVHHVWSIRTVGLDDATIASIATTEYRGVGSGGDCAVCLGEFNDEELVRLLPRCAHPFHASCIDTWLRAHVNCPLCRSPVIVSSDPSASVFDAEIEAGEAEEHQVFEEMSPSESRAEVHEDSESYLGTQREDTETAAEENGMASPKPIRRSASMDSLLFLVVVPEEQDDAVQANRKLRNGQEMRMLRVREKEATSSASCQAGGFGIGRSMSSSGRRFFFALNGRSSGNLLPL